MVHMPSHVDETPAIRTIEQQIEDLKNQTKETAQAKVNELVAEAEVPEEERLSLAEDLMAKLTPIAGFVTDTATDAFETLSEDEFVNSVTNETIRQLGLGTRAGVEGVASLFGIAYDPLKEIVNLGSKIAGGKGDIPSYRAQISQMLDDLGFPEPETTSERVSSAITSGMTAGGGSVSIAKKLAQVLTGLGQKVSQVMATAPAAQVIGSGTGAGSGQTAAELGYNPVVQIAASLAGGLVGGRAANVKTTPISQTVKNTVKDAETAGVPVLTSDVRPPTTFASRWLQKTTESIPIVGTGGVRSAQQELRGEAVQDLARSFGVNLGDDVDIISTVTRDLLKRRRSQLKKYTSQKSSVIKSEKLRDAGVVNVDRAVAAIDQEIATLSRLRTSEVGPVIERLRDWRGALLGETTVKGLDGKNVIVREGQSLENVELLRKQLSQSFEASDLASVKDLGTKTLKKIYNPLREDMRSFIQSFGAKNDIKKFDTSNARLSELVGELENGLFKRVLSKGEVTPEAISSMLFSKKPSDLKLLFKNLDPAGQANARTAIITKMFKDSVNANGGVSPDVFKNQIKKMSDQLGIFFNERDLQSVEGLGRVLALTQRASQANLMPPTGAMLQIPVIGGLLTQTFGGVGAGVVAAGSLGAIARIVESPAVRNILIKLPKVRANSPQEAELLKRLDDIVIRESSTEREGEQIDDVSASDSPALQSLIETTNPDLLRP
tara:strand:- start:55 stop:2217 length:2163 start_codon:yes stop_codon:yes gene_type:complete